MSDKVDLQAIAAALAAPFDPSEVKFKPQAVSGNRALALPYVDARVIQDRLDDVLGVLGWCDSYECLPDGAVVCRLRIRVGGEWITKEDVGGQSEQPDEGDRRKASFSDALKRAAVKFGLGRYLYRQKPQWCDYDPQKRQFVRPPQLPAFTQPPRAAQVAVPTPPEPASQKPAQWVSAFEVKLVAEKLCKPGDLKAHLERQFGQPESLSPSVLDEIQRAAHAFEESCRVDRACVRLEQELARTGCTWEQIRDGALAKGLLEGLGREDKPNAMSPDQWDLVFGWLKKKPDAARTAKAG